MREIAGETSIPVVGTVRPLLCVVPWPRQKFMKALFNIILMLFVPFIDGARGGAVG
jgi:hypothetical protein